MGWGSLGLIVGRGWGQRVCDHVIFVLHECMVSWIYPVSLVLPPFDDTNSLGSPQHRVVYPPGSTMGDCQPFPFWEEGGWAKTHPFFFTPTFPCFPLLLIPQWYSTFECCLLGCSIIIWCVLDKSCADEAECSQRVAGDIMSLVNARSLQLECARVSLLVPVLTYDSKTMIWMEGGRRRNLGLELYRWTTSEVCWASGEWIKSLMHG